MIVLSLSWITHTRVCIRSIFFSLAPFFFFLFFFYDVIYIFFNIWSARVYCLCVCVYVCLFLYVCIMILPRRANAVNEKKCFFIGNQYPTYICFAKSDLLKILMLSPKRKSVKIFMVLSKTVSPWKFLWYPQSASPIHFRNSSASFTYYRVYIHIYRINILKCKWLCNVQVIHIHKQYSNIPPSSILFSFAWQFHNERRRPLCDYALRYQSILLIFTDIAEGTGKVRGRNSEERMLSFADLMNHALCLLFTDNAEGTGKVRGRNSEAFASTASTRTSNKNPIMSAGHYDVFHTGWCQRMGAVLYVIFVFQHIVARFFFFFFNTTQRTRNRQRTAVGRSEKNVKFKRWRNMRMGGSV